MEINKKIENKKIELIYIKDTLQAIQRLEDYIDIERNHFTYQKKRLEKELGDLISVKRNLGGKNAKS